MDKKHNLVYKIKNKINDKFYIGAHSTNDTNDTYFGSGIVLRKAIQKYGIDNFEKVILFDYDSLIDMFDMEKMLVNNILINQSDCYNAHIGGKGGSLKGRKVSAQGRINIGNGSRGRVSHRKGKTGVYSNESVARMSASQRGRRHSEETKRKMSRNMKGSKSKESRERQAERMRDPNHPAHTASQAPEVRARRAISIGKSLKGVPKSDKHKKNISLSKKGKPSPNKGKKLSEETKRKISESVKKRWADKNV